MTTNLRTKSWLTRFRRPRFGALMPPNDPYLSPPARPLEGILPGAMRRSLKRRLRLLGSDDAAHFPLPLPTPHASELLGLPDFIGIGVQRAGTSWWFDLLLTQPGVYHRSEVEIHKERQYFSHLALAEVDFDTLKRDFACWFPRTKGTITGEWTPDYFYYAWVPWLLYMTAPAAKLLLILRDPVERLLSGAMHLASFNRGSLPPADIIQDAFQRGLYAHQLRNWLAHFPINQFLILQYEQCVADPRAELTRTLRFLGIESEVTESAQLHRRVNPSRGAKKRLPTSVRDRFVSLYESDVAHLQSLVPDLNLNLWPNFRP